MTLLHSNPFRCWTPSVNKRRKRDNPGWLYHFNSSHSHKARDKNVSSQCNSHFRQRPQTTASVRWCHNTVIKGVWQHRPERFHRSGGNLTSGFTAFIFGFTAVSPIARQCRRQSSSGDQLPAQNAEHGNVPSSQPCHGCLLQSVPHIGPDCAISPAHPMNNPWPQRLRQQLWVLGERLSLKLTVKTVFLQNSTGR